MGSFPDLEAPYQRVALVHDTTDLFDPETQDALDARYSSGGGGGVLPIASTTIQGIVELATTTEAETGTDTTRAVTPEGVAISALNQIALMSGYYRGVNAQTGTTYTPVQTDAGKLVTLSNASPIAVTLPQDSSLAISVGGRIDFAGINTGLVTFAAGSGATVNGTPSLVTRARYSAVTAIKIAANTWLLVGDLA